MKFDIWNCARATISQHMFDTIGYLCTRDTLKRLYSQITTVSSSEPNFVYLSGAREWNFLHLFDFFLFVLFFSNTETTSAPPIYSCWRWNCSFFFLLLRPFDVLSDRILCICVLRGSGPHECECVCYCIMCVWVECVLTCACD